MPHFLIAISLAIAVVLTEPRIQANERIRRLGKDPLGESLEEFQVRYPKAICGAKPRPRNLTNANSNGHVYCYLDDLDSLAKISPSPFLNLGVRAVSAHFWRSRLYSLSFDLNVRSIQTVLKPFKQIYGSPTLIVKDDPADPLKLRYLYWVEHGIGLQVLLSHSAGEAVQKNSAQPDVETVSVALWNSEFGIDRK
jgi:hypothetical protein